MGNDVSQVEPILHDADVFANVPLNKYGKLIVIGVPPRSNVIQSIENAVSVYLRRPEIKPVEPLVTTIKCKTNFSHSEFEVALQLKLVWTTIFYRLHSIGFRPLISTDMQRFENTQNFQFFEKTRAPMPAALALVSLSSKNKFQVITGHGHHAEIMDSMETIMKHVWGKMRAKQKSHNVNQHWQVSEIDLGSYVWSNSSGEDLTRGRYLLGWVSTNLGKEYGWKLYTAANIKGNCDFLWFYKGGDYAKVPIEELPPPPQYFEHSTGFAGYGGRLLADTRPAVVSLCSTDKLRICGVPTHLIDAIRHSLTASGLGIQKENRDRYRSIGNGFEFKLHGNPWWTSGEKAIRVRVAFMRIFEAALQNQYRVLASLNTSRKLNDKSSFILVPCETLGDFSRVRSLVIATSAENHMRIIGSYTDAELRAVLRVVNQFPGGIKTERWQSTVDQTEMSVFSGSWRCYFLEFRNDIWSSWGTARSSHISSYVRLGGHTVMTLINIMTVLRHQGWELVCDADVSGKYVKRKNRNSTISYRIDTDEWFFVKVE